MSPTSYQTAPPRNAILSHRRALVFSLSNGLVNNGGTTSCVRAGHSPCNERRWLTRGAEDHALHFRSRTLADFQDRLRASLLAAKCRAAQFFFAMTRRSACVPRNEVLRRPLRYTRTGFSQRANFGLMLQSGQLRSTKKTASLYTLEVSNEGQPTVFVPSCVGS
jgi:hypothetical protein